MKKIIAVILLIICCQSNVFAQSKNNLYADLTINNLGTSVTYDRRIVKHFDMGIGFSVNDFNSDQYHNIKFATFLDFRPYRVVRRNLFFGIADIGMMFYGGRIPQPDKASLNPNSLYVGLGLGYGVRINKRGMGPYISLSMDGSTTHQITHNASLAPQARDYIVFDAELVLAVGFKF